MTVGFKESYHQEFWRFSVGRAQAWLRGEGVESALVYFGSDGPSDLRIDVPVGTPIQLLDGAVRVGKKYSN